MVFPACAGDHSCHATGVAAEADGVPLMSQRLPIYSTCERRFCSVSESRSRYLL